MKFLKKLFVVPSDEQVTEKCMTRVMVCSILSILLCVVCLASTTWAWYETQETYSGSVIRGGQWDVPTTLNEEPTQEPTVPETTVAIEETQPATQAPTEPQENQEATEPEETQEVTEPAVDETIPEQTEEPTVPETTEAVAETVPETTEETFVATE